MQKSNMHSIIQIQTRVLPGNRVEITSPELAEGEIVNVTVSKDESSRSKRSVLEMIESFPVGRIFKSAKEIDAFLAEERRSWER
jgi:hypothetical protein